MTSGNEASVATCAACGMALAEDETHVCGDCESFFAMDGIELSEHLRSESDEITQKP
ncbi:MULTISPECIES: protein NinF [Rahnella]|uniref:Protein ninF n=1 Tax=Rahnella laticis TaxID=2787622 RepID=A0ABS0DZ44_9GAMM|nr:hypothetical protein [Rahnella laticis]MBF7998182.1 hypothetical protein [Rahnella sp. LAC-M12]